MNKVMEVLDSMVKDMSARVHIFCDDVISGKVEKDLLERHQIPQDYIDVCRDGNHPSCRKMKNRLFEYLMRRIGYYENIGNAERIAGIHADLDKLLYDPKEDNEQQGLNMPRMILGVKAALNKIEGLNNANVEDFAEKNAVSNVTFGKTDRSFEMGYKRDPRVPVSLERTPSTQTIITIGGEDYVVPVGGSYVSGHRVTFTQPDEVTVRFDRLHSASLQEDKAFFSGMLRR